MSDCNYDYGSCARITVCGSQGGRKYMEDRLDVHCQRKPNGELDYIYLGVYDGHGGADASHYAKEHLRFAITEQKCFHSDDDESVLRAIKDGFLQTHYEMWKTFENWPKTASGYPSTSGTTASIAIIKRGKVYFGHVGDSAIVIGKKFDDSSVDGTMITIDHKPDHPEELRRIEEMGGEVMNKSGVMRVVWTRTTRGHQGPVRRSTNIEKVPFLAVARALGDLWSYNSALDVFVVSPEPDVGVVKLEPNDVCLLLGSDGLWNVIKAQNSVEIVNSHEWRELQDKSSNLQIMQSNHARWLARHALLRWGNLRADNISVIAVLLDPPNTCNEKMMGVVVENPYLDVDEILTEYPSALIRVTPKQTQVAKTKPVELVYFGASDPSDKTLAMNIYGARNGLTTWSYQHRNTALTYRGPGYNACGDDRPENWSILNSILDKFLVKPTTNRFAETPLMSSTTTTNWEMKIKFEPADDENHLATIKEEKVSPTSSSNGRGVMLLNNRPNLINTTPSKTTTNYVENIGEKNLHIIVTTPKRRCVAPTDDAVDSISVDDAKTTSPLDSKRNVNATLHRKRRSQSSPMTPPVTCGYYNLRRCTRVTRSGAKLSPPTPKTVPSIVRHHHHEHHHRRRTFRRFGLISATVDVAGLHRTRRLTCDSSRKNVLYVATAGGKNLNPPQPYCLRERPQSATTFEAKLKLTSSASLIVDATTSETKKRSIACVASSSNDDTLSVSFAKRLKIFVDAGLNRFRRENN